LVQEHNATSKHAVRLKYLHMILDRSLIGSCRGS
jgi:hypothetical protein